ncbi:MAG TPA: nucleotidyltransferase domain-containing protein [Candidatus Bathyarchaeia archaeon]|nr:nucleotidyltransferase domain-containing protein [Candidatus Bathyarchaeia archaeon]
MTEKLRGENRIREFKQVAKKLTSRLSSFEGVLGIAFIGGLVRGFADKYSDLDIIVLLARRDEQLRRQFYDLSSDVARVSGVDVDLEVHFIDDFKGQKWDEIDRWEFSKVKIVFDPEGVVQRVFREKLKQPKDFWTKRIALLAEYMKWYCCPPKENVGTVAQTWVDRGDLLSAHYCLNYAVDLVLKVVFTLNKEHLPAPKWRLFYSYNLKWLPKGFSKLIKDAMKATDFSTDELEFRLRALRELWHGVVPKIRDVTGLTMEELSEYFVEKILRVRAAKYK